jgi:hypothetical protein
MVKSRFLSAPHDIAQQQRRLEIKNQFETILDLWLRASERVHFYFPGLAGALRAAAQRVHFQIDSNPISGASVLSAAPFLNPSVDVYIRLVFYGVFSSSQMRDAIVIRAIGDYFAY